MKTKTIIAVIAVAAAPAGCSPPAAQYYGKAGPYAAAPKPLVDPIHARDACNRQPFPQCTGVGG